MKQLLKRALPAQLKRWLGLRSKHCKISYSQEGEDRILSVLLGLNGRNTAGFYVDVGAHHPERYSNTLLFYANGWSGINIDAMPGSMRPFRKERPRDINVEAAVSERPTTLMFYEFNEPALNGFSSEVAAKRENTRGWAIVRKTPIPTVRLETLLERHLSPDQTIDFMSIDVEGLDLEVLKSSNWTKFRPAVVLVEDNENDGANKATVSPITTFMDSHGYQPCCRTLLTTFFVDKKQIEYTSAGLRINRAGVKTPNRMA